MYQIHSLCLDSSNSNHSRTTFPPIASYFLFHLCVINLLVQTLKKEKKCLQKKKIEICYNLSWKYSTLLIVDGVRVSNGCLYHKMMKLLSEYGTSECASSDKSFYF